MASRLVQIKSVEQFRKMHEAGVARYVYKMNGQIGVDEPTSPAWTRSSERVIDGAIRDKLLWYYVEEDDSPTTEDE